MNIQLSRKQIQALQLFDRSDIVDILYGGGAGGAKSLTICLWILIQCRNFPGIRIGLGRKELTKLKQSTLHTLLFEAHKMLGIREQEFNYSEQRALVSYINGSSIQLFDLAYMPSDPDYDRLGSLNLTHVVIEEGGEVPRKARDIFISRKNRYLNNQLNIVGKSITTCNPSQNFLKSEYYKPYKKLGGGEYQQWEYGQVEIDGKMQTAYRAFIRSLVNDNPFISRNYIEVLRKLPPAERKRLLEGNWDYEDNDFMLFKPSLIDRVIRSTIDAGKRYIGVDISDSGGDKTIMSLVEGDLLVQQRQIVTDKTEAIGEQIALEIIKYAQQNGIDANSAKDVGIDGIGVGASTRDFLRSKGWRVTEFIAGAGSNDPMYNNIRGEAIYSMYLAMDRGEFGIYQHLETMEALREDLMAHEYSSQERKILIKSKKDIKEVLGRSPDHAESAYIAFWVAKGHNDPKSDSSRIIF